MCSTLSGDTTTSAGKSYAKKSSFVLTIFMLCRTNRIKNRSKNRRKTRSKKQRTNSRCVVRDAAEPKMHVRLLKKIGAHHFVGCVLASNAIVRFCPTHLLVAQEGTLCHVTNCLFDCGSKLVKCEAVSQVDANPETLALTDVAEEARDAALGKAPDTTTVAGPPKPAPGRPGPSKRKRVSFSDDDAACSALH